ncbi:MAG: 50S ribosomal protein L29 [Firmicutes bacterium]|nr:50S ribosomal protein L29 [Bacillota bacterium]
MKASEIRELSDKELRDRIQELKEELFNLRFQIVTGHLENNMRLKKVRRSIARIKTVLRERELAEAGVERRQ